MSDSHDSRNIRDQLERIREELEYQRVSQISDPDERSDAKQALVFARMHRTFEELDKMCAEERANEWSVRVVGAGLLLLFLVIAINSFMEKPWQEKIVLAGVIASMIGAGTIIIVLVIIDGRMSDYLLARTLNHFFCLIKPYVLIYIHHYLLIKHCVGNQRNVPAVPERSYRPRSTAGDRRGELVGA